ncbi:MAG TPA: HAMP domain-containing sensor histidine kinase, partial [Acidobacteriota bacterium]
HQLLVLTDLSRALREEERQVWQRLIRVLGHELNNSLAPIKSIAGSLRDLSRRSSRPEDWRDDLQRGLEIIESRSEALSNFIGAYAKLARLPQPVLQNVDLETWIKRVVGLETRVHVELIEGEGITLLADPDQLEQLLINLLRNAVDAALETGGGVKLAWTIQGDQLQIRIEDDGPGLPDSSNLFVPFFTTKPGGSGIGLVLCRQIAEAHGGSLTIQNKSTGHGCLVNLTLPLHNAPSRTHINSKVLVK